MNIIIPVDNFWNAFGLNDVPKPNSPDLGETIPNTPHNMKLYKNAVEEGIDYYLRNVKGFGGATLDLEKNEVVLTIKDPEAFAMEIMNTMNGYGFVETPSFEDFKEGRDTMEVIEDTFGWLASRGEVYGGKSLNRIINDQLNEERNFEFEDMGQYLENEDLKERG